MDGIELEIVWSNLISIVSEQAKALQRIAFSPIVREAGDLANALFDRRGRMVAQAVTGTPGHINSLAAAGVHFIEAFPTQTVNEGDVLVTNDPWLTAGHFFDITVMVPCFHNGKLVGFFGSTIHHTDIGGYGVGAGARDVHEEGLWIPMLKLYERGEPNKVLHDIIRRNVRTPNEVFGDLAAQVSSGKLAAKRLSALLDRQGYDDIESLSDEIITRSEEATREFDPQAQGWHLPRRKPVRRAGWRRHHAEDRSDDRFNRRHRHHRFHRLVGADPYGINVVMNYTHAYSTFAIRSCLNPELPNNFGSLAPIKVVAPEGCIVNCKYPAPVNARHVVGMYVAMPVLKALYHVIPDRVLAEGSGAVWTIQIQGKDQNGDPFTSSMFNYSGGMGARQTKPGPSATCYPTGVAAVPVEVLEAAMPIVFERKELREGSGGAGKSRGGDGQVIAWHMRTNSPWLLNAVPSRTSLAPEGLGGGEPGLAGKFLVNGKAVSEARKLVMQAGDQVTLETPGGGGYGKAPS